jgi:hypothetical protein
MNKRPNFFIIGAPKCGTTALSKYLSEHPKVFFCDPKEPHYFADDFDGHRAIKNLTKYLSLFKDVKPNQIAIGEGSVFYLYSKNAIRNIYKFDSNARIIVMLRNPVDLVTSLHQQNLHALYEDEVEFEKAWDLQSVRMQNKSIPRLCRQPELLMYSEIGKLGVQVERLLSIFPEKQVKVILFDDFVKETSKVYKEVLSFLEIEDDNRTIFENVNEGQALRGGLLGFFARRSPIVFRNLVTKMRFNSYLSLIPNLADRMLKVKSNRKPLDVNFKLKLKNFFKEDVDALGNILGVNIDRWKL